MGEKVLVYGSGARDHCLVDEYAESKHVDKVYIAPGNPGIDRTRKAKQGHIERLPLRNFKEIAKFCKEKGVTLVDVGSENPLDEGLIDILTEEGIACLGPKQEYVRIENDREFTDKLLSKIGKAKYGYEYAIKPEWKSFADPLEAKKYVRKKQYQVVVKANGLAAGKGAIVCDDVDQAEKAIDTIMVEKKFGKSGEKVIIEERKYGKEISYFVYLDGENILPLKMFAQDYKPAFDPDDEENIKLFGGNLNTGGTGCYCPHKLIEKDERISNKIIKEIVNPFVDEIYNNLGWNYKGVLYFGLNLDDWGKLDVFEINVRHGDPEWEVIGRKLQTDLFEIGIESWRGNLDKIKQTWNDRYYVDFIAMVGRSKDPKGGWYPGYPGRYGDGYEIKGLENIERGIAIFYSGVDEHPERGLVTKGGRVLHVVASSLNLEEAIEKAHRNIEKIAFIDHNNENKNCLRFRKTIGRD